MSSTRKRAAIGEKSLEGPRTAEKRIKILEREAGNRRSYDPSTGVGLDNVHMSLRCIECGGNIADSTTGTALSFFEDGESLYLVMNANDTPIGAAFKVKDVAKDKMPTETNPYASVAHVLCANKKASRTCHKKVGAVKCCPPFSEKRLLFFQHKALLVDGSKPQNWKSVRDNVLKHVQLIQPMVDDQTKRFESAQRPPVVRSVDVKDAIATAGQLTRSSAQSYQLELFRAVVASKRNSVVFLPTGLGKTLLAAMVLKRLLSLNQRMQAYFLVDVAAVALQQAEELQAEMLCPVEVMVGSTLVNPDVGGNSNVAESNAKVNSDYGVKRRLRDMRDARVVVATTGAFEHAMSDGMLDPRAVCCVVLDEAQKCGKDHPFNRVAKTFLLPRAATSTMPASRPANELPKLVGLASSSAGELSVPETVVKVEELLARFGADLAAPVETLQQVKKLTPPVELEIRSVKPTPPEAHLLGSLKKLVLKRVARLVPGSDVGRQAERLLLTPGDRSTQDIYTLQDGVGSASDAAIVGHDSWRFPNEAFTAICRRAIRFRRRRDLGKARNARDVTGGELAAEPDGENTARDRLHLLKLMKLAHAIDEIGGDATWRSLLRALEEEEDEATSEDGGRDSGGGLGGDSRRSRGSEEADREDLIHDLRRQLTAPDSGGEEEEGEPEAGGGRRASGFGAAGSKLETIANILREHKEKVDACGAQSSAVVFVSNSDLAQVTCAMLKAVPSLKPYTQAQPIVGMSDRDVLARLRQGSMTAVASISGFDEEVELPAHALIVCASVPFHATMMVQLRGRVDCKEGCRFVGLGRHCGGTEEEEVRTLCFRESNMLSAIEHLSAGTRGSKGGNGMVNTSSSTTAMQKPSGADFDRAPSGVSSSATSEVSRGGAAMSPPLSRMGKAAISAAAAVAAAAAVSSPELGGMPGETPFKPPKATLAVGKTPGGGDANVADTKGAPADGVGVKDWKKTLPDPPSGAARKYAAAYLATCVRQAAQRKPDQMARCTINTAVQLAHTIKPVLEYDERRLPGPAHESIFEARCSVQSKLEELQGLIVVKEAKGVSIKAAREKAAIKVVQYLMAKESGSA